VSTAYDFDDKFTSKMSGFKGAGEYYYEAGSFYLMHQIKVPLFSINSHDDSSTFSYNEFQKNSNMIAAKPMTGGHVGWFTGLIVPKRWFPVPCLEFLDACINME